MTHQQRLTQAMAVPMTEVRSALDAWRGSFPDSVQAEGSSERERNDIGSDPNLVRTVPLRLRISDTSAQLTSSDR